MRRAGVCLRRSTPPVSSVCLFPFSLCNPSFPASQCVFEWVKHCHSPIASRETLLQTDWRSTAKGSLAGFVCVCVHTSAMCVYTHRCSLCLRVLSLSTFIGFFFHYITLCTESKTNHQSGTRTHSFLNTHDTRSKTHTHRQT